MLRILGILLALSARLLRSRRELLLENLASRQRLSVMIRKQPRRRMTLPDKLFWTLLARFWSGWKRAILIVQPETVVRWHRAGFKLYWTWISRKRRRSERRPTGRELRELIFRMVAENPTWGAPRIHGQLHMLGFEICQRTVLNWMRKAPLNPEPARRWATFLHNHREVIPAMDLFTVPRLTFGVLYRFFLIAHERRRVLHFNVTRQPSSAWVSQQLREAFPYDSAPKYLIHDRDAIFNDEVVDTAEMIGLRSVRTAFRSPWQNGIAERFMGSCRRDLLDHVIMLKERQMKQLMSKYLHYYHEHRTHLGLDKQTPAGRTAATGTTPKAKIISTPRLGGLHHRYNLAA